MTVYFIQAGEGGRVKIGLTDDVERRLGEIQAHNHMPLRVMRTVEGGRNLEAWFHRRFAALREHAEWFAFSPDMLSAQPPHELGFRAAMDTHSLSLSERVINAFGGLTQTSRALGRTGRIPLWRYHEIRMAALRLGIKLPKDFPREMSLAKHAERQGAAK